MERSTFFPALAATALALASSAWVRFEMVEPGRDRAKESQRVDVLVSPGPDVLRLVALEHPHGWADLFWLGIIQDFGAFSEGRTPDFDRFANWADIATDLDPQYFTVYHASAIDLTVYGKRAAASDLLLEKGRRHLPDRWELPFMLGYNAYFIHGDPDAAARYWLEAAQLPRVPRYVPSLAARATFQSGREHEAEELLESMLEWLEGPQRDDAIIRLKIIRSEPILRAYDDACAAFQQETGRIPTAQELYASGRVSYPPIDLLDGPIELDEGCRARTEVIHVREDEAVDRIGSEGHKEEEPTP